jgi:tetratricopeptide (TPR) repeat protein
MRQRNVRMATLVGVAVLLAFLPVTTADFVYFDDPNYVFENPVVKRGVTLQGLTEAFSSFATGNWHPLTWVSHMLDVQIYGLRAGGHHLTSLLLHVAAAVVLFLALAAITGKPQRSAIVAFLFGLHPMHVETVAWVSERKDVLSGLFWMLTIGAYARYARRPGLPRYLAVVLLFALGLMSKAMLVTLPLVLLLLDYWPLARWGSSPSGVRHSGSTRGVPGSGRIVLEKIPLLALSAAASLVALAAQKSVGTLGLMNMPHERLQLVNAVRGYAWYLEKAFLPIRLAVFYPERRGGSALDWQFWASAGVLLALTIAALALRRKQPYLAIGWLWFVGVLVPVIGLVKIGAHAVADRYTYLPYVGLFLALVWGCADTVGRLRWPRRLRAACAAAAVAALMILCYIQAGYWRNGVTLFGRAAQVTQGNWLAYNSLGVSLYMERRYREAAAAYLTALEIYPGRDSASYNLGLAYLALQRLPEAAAAFREAVRLNPAHVNAQLSLGKVYVLLGDRTGAIERHAVLRTLDARSAEQLWRIIGGGFR